MRDIIVFGCGGLGRETMFQLEEQNRLSGEYNILGFADDSESLWGTEVSGYTVHGGSEYLCSYGSELCVVIAIGKPCIRKSIYERLSANNKLDFPTVAAPGAVYSKSVRLGKGCIIGFFASLTVDIEVGDFVLISNGCNIGHDSVIEDFATLYPGVHISGNVQLEKECEIGVGSNIIQGLSVGERTVIGAGAAVIRDIPSDCTAVGVPAKIIKKI